MSQVCRSSEFFVHTVSLYLSRNCGDLDIQVYRSEQLVCIRVRASYIQLIPPLTEVLSANLQLLKDEQLLFGRELKLVSANAAGAPSTTDISADILQNYGCTTDDLLLQIFCQSPLDPDRFTNDLYRRTLFGSPVYTKFTNGSKIRLKIGVDQPKERLPSETKALSSWEFKGCRLTAFAKPDGFPLKDSVEIRAYSERSVETSEILLSDIARAYQVEYGLLYGLQPKSRLAIDVWQVAGGTIDVLEAISSQRPDGLGHAVRGIVHEALQRTTQALEMRKSGVERRPQVFVDFNQSNICIGPEPENETETIMLAIRLEPILAKQLYGIFQILGHTSQIGIDSFVLWRENNWIPSSIDPLEFEFDLLNFFKHAHPLKQVKMIICWTSQSVGVGSHDFGEGTFGEGPLRFNIDGFGWKRTIQYEQHLITVLSLNCLPGLIVRPNQ